MHCAAAEKKISDACAQPNRQFPHARANHPRVSKTNRARTVNDSAFPILNVRTLTKSYATGAGQLTVLKDISFTAAGRDLLDPRSIRQRQDDVAWACAPGLDLPTSGSVLLNGIALAEIGEDERARMRNEHVGFVFQNFQLIPTLTALGKRDGADGIARRSQRADARAWICCSGSDWRSASIIIRRNFPAANSSASRSRALSSTGRRFFLPTNRPAISMPRRAQAVIEIMLELNRSAGTALVLVTHDPDVGERLNGSDDLGLRRRSEMRS